MWIARLALPPSDPLAESDKLARRAKAAGWPGVAGSLLIGLAIYLRMHACFDCTALHGT
jgi:hypothetical protein